MGPLAANLTASPHHTTKKHRLECLTGNKCQRRRQQACQMMFSFNIYGTGPVIPVTTWHRIDTNHRG